MKHWSNGHSTVKKKMKHFLTLDELRLTGAPLRESCLKEGAAGTVEESSLQNGSATEKRH
jgi:hypothetical protein